MYFYYSPNNYNDMTEANQYIEFLQMHYYLDDNKHSMNAKVFNKVETELLKIIDEVSKVLELDVTVEVQALEEGGVKAIYKFLNKKKNRRKIYIIGAFLAGIISTIISNVISENINTDSEYERLKKEKIQLEIQKLKKELEEVFDKAETEYENNKTKNIVLSQELIKPLSIFISELNQVKISKSKFYKHLVDEDDINKISTQEFNDKLEPVSIEKFVPRKDFKLFIINETEIEPDYQYNVVLEIVSPVLKRTKMSWKAIADGKPLTFTMKDENFINLVINKNLQFSNGTSILCEVETKQKMNDDGEIIKMSSSVYNVSKILYPDGTIVDI